MKPKGSLSKRRILHIDLDTFFVSVERLRDSSLIGKPVAVGGGPGNRGVVASASYEIRAYGVRAGTPLGQARRLCPSIIIVPPDFERYSALSRRFMGILAGFSPDLEPWGMDEAFLDITGFEPFYGPVEAAAQRIRARVRAELGLAASIGVATSRMVAKVASDRAKPDGLLVVPPGEEASFLAPLPVKELPFIGSKTEEALHSIGVESLGQLAALPRDFVKGYLGKPGEVIHLWSGGIDISPVRSEPDPQKSVSHSTTLPKDTRARPFLRSLLYYLSERVEEELWKLGKRAGLVVVKMRYSDFKTVERQHPIRPPTDSASALYQLGAELMEELLDRNKQPIRLLGIGASNLTEAGTQLNLWDGRQLKEARLKGTIEAIRSRYGRRALQRGVAPIVYGEFGKWGAPPRLAASKSELWARSYD